MFPIIPILALFGIVGGGATLIWYDGLSNDEQQKADRIACGYARNLFGKSLEELTRAEANRVASLTERHFSQS